MTQTLICEEYVSISLEMQRLPLQARWHREETLVLDSIVRDGCFFIDLASSIPELNYLDKE